MAKNRNHFKCTILSPKNLVFEEDIQSLFIVGDRNEYELLAYHYPLIGLIKKGDIIINWQKEIPIRSGILRFFANECTILIEESDKTVAAGQSKEAKLAKH